jgi:hypothetical protein
MFRTMVLLGSSGRGSRRTYCIAYVGVSGILPSSTTIHWSGFTVWCFIHCWQSAKANGLSPVSVMQVIRELTGMDLD